MASNSRSDSLPMPSPWDKSLFNRLIDFGSKPQAEPACRAPRISIRNSVRTVTEKLRNFRLQVPSYSAAVATLCHTQLVKGKSNASKGSHMHHHTRSSSICPDSDSREGTATFPRLSIWVEPAQIP